ncbi:hypothetical protein GGS26DRAFT_538304 [Hypomontagnella submonticulosa]|nr:hypothetical protein GGS26DRAFT_538304 [Hypomontagnella submonticulosa]
MECERKPPSSPSRSRYKLCHVLKDSTLLFVNVSPLLSDLLSVRSLFLISFPSRPDLTFLSFEAISAPQPTVAKMAVKFIALLALAGSALAQMSGMDSNTMMSTDTASMSDASSISQPTDPVSVTTSYSTVTDSGSSTSMPTDMSSSMSTAMSSSDGTSMTMDSSMSSASMTDDMSSMTTETGSMGATPTDSGSMASDTPSATLLPGTGGGAATGVSVCFQLVLSNS